MLSETFFSSGLLVLQVWPGSLLSTEPGSGITGEKIRERLGLKSCGRCQHPPGNQTPGSVILVSQENQYHNQKTGFFHALLSSQSFWPTQYSTDFKRAFCSSDCQISMFKNHVYLESSSCNEMRYFAYLVRPNEREKSKHVAWVSEWSAGGLNETRLMSRACRRWSGPNASQTSVPLKHLS